MNIMQKQYRGRTAKFKKNGIVQYAKFDDADIRKNIYGDKKSSRKGWKAKINVGADGDIFELVENAKYKGSAEEQGKETASHRNVSSWDYYVKTVQIDGQMYDLLANVRKKPDGEYCYSIQLNEHKKKAAAPPLAPAYDSRKGTDYAQNGVPTDASNSSIYQDTKKGKKLSLKDGREDLKALRKGKKLSLKDGREDLKALRSERKEVRDQIGNLEWLEERNNGLSDADAAELRGLREQERILNEKIEQAREAAKETERQTRAFEQHCWIHSMCRQEEEKIWAIRSTVWRNRSLKRDM